MTVVDERPTDVPVVDFATSPDRYRHWRVEYDDEVATVVLQVAEDGGIVPGYELKMNSYDLGVDIELHDIVQRLRFEHPEVKAVVLTGGQDRMFCAGANIRMLARSSHAWKVNFCKFTNETRNEIEDATESSGQTWLAAINGTAAGGGYELALACADLVLIDDGSSTVSLPEVPLLGVIPGTGGLTRVVDKRKVRRDLGDAFSTLAEGVKGKRAVEWGLVDAVVPRSKFADTISQRARELAAKAGAATRGTKGVTLDDLGHHKHVSLKIDDKTRTAELTVKGPESTEITEDSNTYALRMA